MNTARFTLVCSFAIFVLGGEVLIAEEAILAGVATVDITPEEPVWLSGYASRDHAHTHVAERLYAKAIALGNAGGEERTVLVSLDNCEVTSLFTAPVLKEIEKRHGLPPASVIIVSTHTHSGPALPDTLPGMFGFEGEEAERIRRYGTLLRQRLVEVVGVAVERLAPVELSYGSGRAGFAMNRRVYRDHGVTFGNNPDAPVVHDVPVLRVSDLDGKVVAILFGYACHGTTIGGASGDEFYAISGDYMGYARRALEDAWPGAHALYLAGFGADINPAPRGSLALSRQHGLELAGAVSGVLGRPMRPVRGPLRARSRTVPLPLQPPPSREMLQADAKSQNRYVRLRAELYLSALDAGKPRPEHVDLAMSVLRIGDDVTFLFVAGEVVIDYALRLGRELTLDRPWLVGYAREVPCYIPSRRILREGGYEADSSLIYYGIYGPFRPVVEDRVVEAALDLVAGVR